MEETLKSPSLGGLTIWKKPPKSPLSGGTYNIPWKKEEKNIMAYLLTGGMGCIGTYVIRDLLAAGEKVVVYDFAYDLTIPKMVLTDEQIEGFTFVQGDITDLPHVLRTVQEHEIDRVIHLASWQVPACNANPPQALKVVCEGTINILEAARIFNLKRVVWASSVCSFRGTRGLQPPTDSQ